MLASLISPTKGYAVVNGHDVVKESLKVRESVGILTENPSLYDRLTAQENMEFFAEASSEDNNYRSQSRIILFYCSMSKADLNITD